MRALAGMPDDGVAIAGTIRKGITESPQFAPALRRPICQAPFRPLSPNASPFAQLARVLRASSVTAGERADGIDSATRTSERRTAARGVRETCGRIPERNHRVGIACAGLAQTPDLLLVDHLFEGSRQRTRVRWRTRCCRESAAEIHADLRDDVRGNRDAARRTPDCLASWPDCRRGTVARLVTTQAHAYTQTLFKEEGPRERSALRGQPVVQALGLSLASGARTTGDISFELRRGASLALIGEEGSGRRALTRAILGLRRLEAGRIVFDAVDIGILSSEMMSRLRRRVAIVAGADDVLDPRMSLSETVAEPLRAHLHLRAIFWRISRNGASPGRPCFAPGRSSHCVTFRIRSAQAAGGAGDRDGACAGDCRRAIPRPRRVRALGDPRPAAKLPRRRGPGLYRHHLGFCGRAGARR